eukprot:TRINITY_DN64_c0_g3_i1.p1 TRINITY_DN64_c0_g3~~TRINITY_DN64_c0_g3_i1.p1  ORF type:complete len:379 (-),score=135.64 TRINITY_DN64_c0_g3_i1:118-1254(-)
MKKNNKNNNNSIDNNNRKLSEVKITQQQIRNAIPKHCFQRSALYSSLYLLIDFLFVFFFFWCALNLEQQKENLNIIIEYICWLCYWIAQGCVCTGLWVIAHECGHRAFSESTFINDFVGLFVHSALLVPYHSWRISHHNHHAHTNNIEFDEVFVPNLIKYNQSIPKESFFETTFIGRILNLIFMLTLGWPGYLFFNITSRKYEQRASHFEPNSPIFKKEHYSLIVISDLFLIFSLSILIYCCYIFSIAQVIRFYIIPYLIVNMWLVLITYLQHSDSKIPHWYNNEWTWIKGAIAGTIDRNYGFLNYVFHHIGDTHVLHHFCSTIPHYHAVEATNYLKKILAENYNYDPTPIWISLWRNYANCRFVQSDNVNGPLWYRK